MVLNLLTGSISPQYHVVFDDMFSTVVISTYADPEIWIRLVTSNNSSIQVMLDQEDDPDLDNEWLTDDERLTSFSKAREINCREVQKSIVAIYSRNPIF